MENGMTTTSIITRAQLEEIMADNMVNNHFSTLFRRKTEMERRCKTMLIQADNNLTELADLQQKKKERTRIAEMMENGDRVSKTEELIFTKSQLIDEEISDLQKRDLALMTENEKLYEKVEQAKRSLRDHVINKMKATHAEEENGVCYKVGSAACLLQPAQEDEKTVGALWVNFFKENDLRTLTTAKVMPLLRRYVEAIPRSNPDPQRVQDALDLLRDHPECPRFQFYEKVKLTMNPSNMQVFVDAVNNIYDNEEHRTDLNNSMDQQRCARQLFTQKRTSHHLEKSLMKEFYEHRNTMSAEQVEELGITADMIRKYEKRGQRDRQSNRGRNNRYKTLKIIISHSYLDLAPTTPTTETTSSTAGTVSNETRGDEGETEDAVATEAATETGETISGKASGRITRTEVIIRRNFDRMIRKRRTTSKRSNCPTKGVENLRPLKNVGCIVRTKYTANVEELYKKSNIQIV